MSFSKIEINEDIALLNKKEIKVLPREVQTDPLNDKPIHIDFLRINDESKINISVPIIFINEDKSPGLKSGCVLNAVRREIDLICKINNIRNKKFRFMI